MALVKCGECRQRISDRASACPHCGCPVTPADVTKRDGWLKATKISANGHADSQMSKSRNAVVGVIVVLGIIGACSSSDKKGASTNVRENATNAACAPGTVLKSAPVDVTGFNHPMHQTPDSNSPRVVNEKASKALGTTEYKSIDAENQVRPLCEYGEWRKVQFVGVDWPETGWVKAEFLLPPRAAGTPRVFGPNDISLADEKTMNKNRAVLAQGVTRIHAEDSRCSSRISPVVFPAKSKAKGNDQFFVTCGSGASTVNVFFSLADVKSNKKFQNPKDLAISEDSAVQSCKDATRRQAKFPSSVDFSIFGTGVVTQNDGTVLVQLDFEAKNGFGNILPQRAICEYPVKGNDSIRIGAR